MSAARWAGEMTAAAFVAKVFGLDDLITAVERARPQV